MLTKTVNHEDLDGNPTQSTLYFHIGKADFIINPGLRRELEDLGLEMQALGEELQGDGTTFVLSDNQKQQMIDLIVKMMKFSYGVRRDDNKGFKKTPEIWEEFTGSLAFEALLILLMTNEQELVGFMTGVMPNDVRAQIAADSGQEVLPGMASQPTATVTQLHTDMEEPDFETLLAEADAQPDPNAGKKGVSASQWAFMQSKLNGAQFQKFSETHYIKN